MPSVRGPVVERCRAKLNLFLDVVGRRADGFHELVTIFHEVELCDDLTVAVTDEAGVVRIEVEPASEDVPADGTNLAVRAASALMTDHARAGLALRLTKRIPVGGGLGGGSADAAGALRGVNRLLPNPAPIRELLRLAATLGSDVPFLVEGGSALARGRGEVLERVAAKPMDFLLLVPTFPLATAAVYRALPRELPPPRDPGPTLRALAAGDADALGRVCENALFDAACRVDPRAAEVMSAARDVLGPRVHMTGSGSTFFVPLRAGENVPDVRSLPHLRTTIRTRGRA